MIFKIEDRSFDSNQLPLLGEGTYGDVYDIGNRLAAKLYVTAPDEIQQRKLLKMCDSGSTLVRTPGIGRFLALPLSPALNVPEEALCGFSMQSFSNWPKLAFLAYDIAAGNYREHEGKRLDDANAVKAVFDLFFILDALARRHIVLGDVSDANVLYSFQDRIPGLIDLDSAHFEDWESDSLGTPGFVDPHLSENDLNSVGGLHFDTKSDVFATTVLAFYLVVGAMPFTFGSQPPRRPNDNAKLRLSSFRIAVEGEPCLQRHGTKLLAPQLISAVRASLDRIRCVRGYSGRDGQILYNHFLDVFIEDGRDNLVVRLPESDARNPEMNAMMAIIEKLRGREVVDDLLKKYGMPSAPAPGVSPGKPVYGGRLARRRTDYLERDPSAFGPYLALRGIDYAQMVTA